MAEPELTEAEIERLSTLVRIKLAYDILKQMADDPGKFVEEGSVYMRSKFAERMLETALQRVRITNRMLENNE